MSHNILRMCLVALLSAYATYGFTSTETPNKLLVSIPDAVSLAFPDKVESIKQAILDAGIDADFIILPVKRNIYEFQQKKIHIAAYISTHSAVKDISVRLNPPVDMLKFWLWAADPYLCDLSDDKRRKLSIIGLRGVPVYETQIFPLFEHHIGVTNTKPSLSILLSNRAQFLAWPKAGITTIEDHQKLLACDKEPLRSFPVNSYIQPEFKHLIPALESSYQKHFGDPSAR